MTEHSARSAPKGVEPPGELARGWGLRFLSALLFVQRMLFGFMFVMTGTSWWRRDASPGAYLLESAALALEKGYLPVAPYRAFFESVVLTRPELFASMAAIGELLVGIALILGFPRRVGAIGGVFLMANYGMAFGNGLLPPSGNFMLMVLFIPLLSSFPYRIFTPVHRLLAGRGGWISATGVPVP